MEQNDQSINWSRTLLHQFKRRLGRIPRLFWKWMPAQMLSGQCRTISVKVIIISLLCVMIFNDLKISRYFCAHQGNPPTICCNGQGDERSAWTGSTKPYWGLAFATEWWWFGKFTNQGGQRMASESRGEETIEDTWQPSVLFNPEWWINIKKYLICPYFRRIKLVCYSFGSSICHLIELFLNYFIGPRMSQSNSSISFCSTASSFTSANRRAAFFEMS